MRFLPIIFAMLVLGAFLYPETRVVSTRSEGKTRTVTTEFEEVAKDGGVEVREVGEEGSLVALLDPAGEVRSFEIRSKEADLAMRSDGKVVTVSGTWKGKPIAGSCELKGLGYYGGGFEFALRALARNKLASLKFPMIRPAEPSKSTVMELTREGVEAYKGRSAIKVKVSLAGIMSALWSAHVLVGEDGTILRYTGNRGPGTADIVTELVEVRP